MSQFLALSTYFFRMYFLDLYRLCLDFKGAWICKNGERGEIFIL